MVIPWVFVNIGSGNGLVPEGTKPLPECEIFLALVQPDPMILTDYQLDHSKKNASLCQAPVFWCCNRNKMGVIFKKDVTPVR